MAYRLALPSSLDGVHNVFHVSMLRKYVRDLEQIVELVPMNVQPNLSRPEVGVQQPPREPLSATPVRLLQLGEFLTIFI